MNDAEDWKNQVKHAIRTTAELKKHIDLTPEDETAIRRAETEFSWHITPYYASLMDREDPACQIRLQAVPQEVELDTGFGTMDPLLEEAHNPAPNVIKVYPDRIAWTVSNICPVLCRHCLRKRMIGREHFDFSKEAREAAFAYIERTPEIRDVLITGGDPLMYEDDFIAELVSRLRRIEHVEIIRIGTRTPCTMPQRITDRLCEILKRYHPLFINTQFNHPKEFTPEAAEACRKLANAGIPLGNQSVLLRGINDDVAIMKTLVKGLLRMRVRPYYIYQAQTLTGTGHFITPIEKGLEIMAGLRGYTSGLAVPVYLLDTPYGKIPMYPGTIEKRDDEAVYLRAWNGKIWKEVNRREDLTFRMPVWGAEKRCK